METLPIWQNPGGPCVLWNPRTVWDGRDHKAQLVPPPRDPDVRGRWDGRGRIQMLPLLRTATPTMHRAPLHLHYSSHDTPRSRPPPHRTWRMRTAPYGSKMADTASGGSGTVTAPNPRGMGPRGRVPGGAGRGGSARSLRGAEAAATRPRSAETAGGEREALIGWRA